MYLGTNLQHLRKCNGNMTQEKLSQRMGVSRQTVSKWESGESYPELENLMVLSDIFGCTLDDLLRKDMTVRPRSQVQIVNLPSFRMAQYVIISANAKKDVIDYVNRWALAAGLQDTACMIHWAFPYVSADQKNRFGLNGHGAAWILEEPLPSAADMVITQQNAHTYAMLQIQADALHSLSSANLLYPHIMEFLSENGIKKSVAEGVLPCFEREYQKNGIWYKEVFVLCESIPDAEEHSL